MRAQLALALLLGGLLGIGDDEDPGWLARALASTDPDVDAAIVAYDAGELDRAGEHLDAAVARRGERSELYYDRGLLLLAGGDTDGARTAFQHGTESSELQVQASSHYELGNLAFAAEDWQGAIDAYIACLRAWPDHQNAKWNLELALLRKQEQEKKEKEQEKQDQEKQDQQGDQEKQDQPGEQEKQDQPGDQEKQDQEKQDQQGDQEKQDQEKQDQGEQEQDQEKPGEQEQPQQQPQPSEPQAQPIESGDLDAALDELDRQDAFMFGRPRGNRRKVEKDW
jgi:Ca-activated chloride channel family protein